MELMKNLVKSIKTWVRGSPPMDDVVYKHIHSEFHVLLYASCIFLDLREGHWILSLTALAVYHIMTWGYLVLLSITVYITKNDFVEASHYLHMAMLCLIALTVLFFLNYHRRSCSAIAWAWSRDFYDYEDDFQIQEMEEEIRQAKKTKRLIMVAVPSYLAVTGSVCMLGRTMDEYFGMATNETYVGNVYMMTPMPMWYPFIVDSYFKFLAVTMSQIMGATTVGITIAGIDAAMIFINQAVALQLKTIIYRLRKIEQCAYVMYRKNGGKKLSTAKVFEDPGYLKCYNICLQKTARHHAIIIEVFYLVRGIIVWTGGAAVLIGALIIAMSLFAFVLGGGKPSMTSFVSLLLVGEILNMAMLCSVSEQVAGLGKSLHEELYNLNWINVNMQAKRTMMIMIEQSKRPLILMGGLTPLNWETFSKIMRSAYSYLNLLLAARDVSTSNHHHQQHQNNGTTYYTA